MLNGSIWMSEIAYGPDLVTLANILQPNDWKPKQPYMMQQLLIQSVPLKQYPNRNHFIL